MKKASSLTTDILILGGGLTGLSTAFHLEKEGKTDYLVVEKNSFLGGLCASQQKGKFLFDYSGHLLHLHSSYATNLVRKLLKGNLARIKRKAYISLDKKFIPFPFQSNLWAAPEPIRQECLAEAVKIAQKHFSDKPANFEQWCIRTFGQGIYRHFMRPYNQKLWQLSPRQMAWDWCGSFVPVINLQQIQKGALKPSGQAIGYNAFFYYPKQGGCGALVEALAQKIPNTWLNACVEKIDLTNKQAVINGQTVHFNRLINTLPLKDFISISSAPQSIQKMAQLLKNTTVPLYART